jgi:hypothetical protein
MEVEPVSRMSLPASPAPQPLGISAELAETRQQLRDAAPQGRWDGVLAEVQRLQTQQQMPPLEAMRQVLARLAAGWLPPSR